MLCAPRFRQPLSPLICMHIGTLSNTQTAVGLRASHVLFAQTWFRSCFTLMWGRDPPSEAYARATHPTRSLMQAHALAISVTHYVGARSRLTDGDIVTSEWMTTTLHNGSETWAIVNTLLGL